MPFPMVHLAVANALRGQAPCGELGSFYLGNLAPDAYVMQPKDRAVGRDATHLYDGDAEIWRHNVDSLRADTGGDAFVLGYCTHLIVDILWQESIAGAFRQRYAAGGGDPALERKAYVKEMTEHDLTLYAQASIRDEIWALLKSAPAEGLAGYVCEEDVDAERKRTLIWYDERLRKGGAASPTILKSEEVRSFIAAASAAISR